MTSKDVSKVKEPSFNVLPDFDPRTHINFNPPSKIHTMSDMKLEGKGVSLIAVSEPFQLFSHEAVRRMRSEILSKDVWETAQYSSNLSGGKSQLRGYASKYAPFVYDTWKNPETLAIISEIAGVDLVPEMDFEIAHINLSMKTEAQKQEELLAAKEKEATEADEGICGCPWEDEKPIVDWHTDSYPFVCVTMLSDCTNMVGGETALRTGDGEIVKVRRPQMGCAVILQGRYIEHQALRALGGTERITMVTSFRPKNPTLQDDTVLTTVRPISDLSELYYQFGEYRLEMLVERTRIRLTEMRKTRQAEQKTDVTALKQFLQQQLEFLEHTNNEIIEEELVIKGKVDDSHLFMNRISRGQENVQEPATTVGYKRKRVCSQRPRTRRGYPNRK